MAKGVHSKRRKRNQSIKRKILDESKIFIKILELWRPRLEETSKRLMKRTFGKGDDSLIIRKKNAFRYPKDPASEFPQAEKIVHIDKRAASARTDYLVKEMGSKKKNILKQKHQEGLELALKQAEARAEGREREDEVIDMNKLVQMDEDGNINVDQLDMDKFSINDKSKKGKKNKSSSGGMEVEEERRGGSERRNKKKKGRKSKSYFIVNY